MRIRSGTLNAASFQSDVQDGHSSGSFTGIYKDLRIEFLDSDGEQGIFNRIKSFLADHIKVRTSNAPDASGHFKVGQIDYTRSPNEQFLHFLWFGVRSGMFDVLGVDPKVKSHP